MRKLTSGLLLIIFCFYSNNASAHQMSTGYLNIEADKQGISGELQLRWYDLDLALGLDADQNGKLLWSEILEAQPRLMLHLNERLTVSNAIEACAIRFSPELLTEQHFNEGYLYARFTGDCPRNGEITIDYDFVFDFDQDHKALVNLTTPNESLSFVVNAKQPQLIIQAGEQYRVLSFVQYWKEGIWHIWIGFDHILFLLALLLPAVLVHQSGNWHAAEKMGQVVKQTFWLITAFTLAHSLTLILTAMGWFSLNTKWVELVIALSVLFAALNNMFPLVTRLTWVTFAFGLIHGMGFASVFADLDASSNQSFWAVLAFNLGVETGQLAILIVVLPLLMWIRHFNWYRSYGMQLMSACIGVIAMQWSMQRFFS